MTFNIKLAMPRGTGLGYNITRAINYLRRQKSNRKITHWEIETSDGDRGLFGVRVTVPQYGAFLNQRVSGTYYGRDLLSSAKRAVASVTK